MRPHQSKSILPARRYIVFVLLMLITAIMLLFWVAFTRINDFRSYHLSTARDATTSVTLEASSFVTEKKRLVKLFARENIDLITRFSQSPQDDHLHHQLKQKISEHFPNFFAFTVADANGKPYFEDFDGFVGEYCKDDIKRFAKTNVYHPRIHPNSEAYHFDIMASYGKGKSSGIMFISFHADVLKGVLRSSQALGHDLILTYPELESLIEVTADGARNHWKRDDYRLTPEEKQRVMYQTPVPGTVWHATDMHKPTLFSEFYSKILIHSIIILSVFATIGLFTIIVIRKEEQRREKIDKDLVIAKEQADIANKAKSEFLANMSHELRTPLNAIIGYSEMIEEAATLDKHDELAPDIEKIKNAGLHLLSIIDEILDLSKIEAEKMELYAEDIDLDSLLEKIIATAQPLIDKNNNQLILLIQENLGKIHSDAKKVSQIIFNLISNASKFTKNGNIVLEVLRVSIEGEDSIKIKIKDTGIGMTQDEIQRIFQPFSQADNSTTRKYGGTGLGLAITQRFCLMLGGDIRVTSKTGKGTMFTVWIKSNLNMDNYTDSQVKDTENKTRIIELDKGGKQNKSASYDEHKHVKGV